MFAKLAFRNMKRQIGNYMIYFITVTLTVALMFAIHSVIYSRELQAYADAIKEMNDGLIMISLVIGLIVAFVLGYATSFMLKLRKREFGMYLTMGMTRADIIRLFVLETLIMGGLSLGAGIVIGLFFYQGMMAVMANLMEMEMSFAAYTSDALILTAILCDEQRIQADDVSGDVRRVSCFVSCGHSQKSGESAPEKQNLWQKRDQYVCSASAFRTNAGKFMDGRHFVISDCFFHDRSQCIICSENERRDSVESICAV